MRNSRRHQRGSHRGIEEVFGCIVACIVAGGGIRSEVLPVVTGGAD